MWVQWMMWMQMLFYHCICHENYINTYKHKITQPARYVISKLIFALFLHFLLKCANFGVVMKIADIVKIAQTFTLYYFFLKKEKI